MLEVFIKSVSFKHMATRSNIGIVNADGSVDAIYCHWDGYVTGVGEILNRCYRHESDVRALLALGALSSLGEFINAGGMEHSFDEPMDDVCVAYSRDRGEEHRVLHFGSVKEFKMGGERFNYLYVDGDWIVSEDNYNTQSDWQYLKNLLEKEIA